MRNRLAPFVLAVLACPAGAPPAPLAGQGLTATELDLGALATWSERDFYGVALGLARRPGGQGRLALTTAAGALGGKAAVRLEATLQFLVTPSVRSGVTPYGAMGVTFVGSQSRMGSTVLLALIGLESAAGRRTGWFAEIGLGGGFRLRCGSRWRHLPAWW